MMDEQLIAEVEQHGVIYNRQKYSINNMGVPGGTGGTGAGVNKYETKDEAWRIIAMKLRSDVETCKKRWKYLRERYVSQRKHGDPPVYEHLSRPYLEKMKFLDQHIQPRKSYRNVSSFLTSPNANSSFGEYNMDSSKSNGSLKNLTYPAHQQPQQQSQSSNFQPDGVIKTEADQTFRDFAAAVASQQLQQMNNPQFNSTSLSGSNNGVMPNMTQTVDSFDQYRETEHHPHNLNGAPAVTNGVASSTSSSMKSPLSSPQPAPPPVASNNVSAELSDNHQFAKTSNNNMKKPRVQMSSQYLDTSDSDDNISPLHHPNMLSDNHSGHLHQPHQQQQLHQQQQQQHQQQQQQQQQYNKMLSNAARNMNSLSHGPSTPSGIYPSNNDFLFSLYQQMAPAAVAHQERNTNVGAVGATRTSEHLLGELVTSELLKMNKERRKVVQKRILEILFFED